MKRFIFYALDQYTLKVYRRKEWEAGVQHGIKCEQQRIIKLLKIDAENQTKYCKPLEAEHCHSCFETVRLIALIKGENK